MAQSYAALAALSDEQLKSAYDEKAQNLDPGLNFYRDELNRREDQRSAERQEKINAEMLAITKRVEKATYLALAIAVISLIVSAFK